MHITKSMEKKGCTAISSVIEPVSSEVVSFLAPYLNQQDPSPSRRPFITLTYASSLDSHISLEPGIQTIISGKQSKSLTHYLRKKHDGILIGVGTVVVDDPGLNCRIELPGEQTMDNSGWQPRPIVIDPSFRWNITWNSRILKLTREGKGLAPWVLLDEWGMEEEAEKLQDERIKLLEEHGGKLIRVPQSAKIPGHERAWVWDWRVLLEVLHTNGITSLMIEGGAGVINELLSKEEYLELIDAVIITYGPVYLGRNGVNVSPHEKREKQGEDDKGRKVAAVRFKDVKWLPLGEDVIMAARPLVS